MKPATILSLKVGDAVRDSDGNRGTVRSFGRDHVSIEWESGDTWRHGDDYLKARHVIKSFPFDVEDTRPE